MADLAAPLTAAPHTVRDVLRPDPLTVTTQTGFREAVGLLCRADLEALPVIDGGSVVGLLTSDDLLLKEELAGAPHGGTGGPWQRHKNRVRASGRTVGEVVGPRPPTIGPDTGLGQAAQLLHRRHVPALVVVGDGGELLGVVTRTDLLHVFLREDAALTADVEQAVSHALHDPPEDGHGVQTSVDDGCVRLEGRLRYASQAERVAAAVQQVPGVVAVDCLVRSDTDDVHLSLGF